MLLATTYSAGVSLGAGTSLMAQSEHNAGFLRDAAAAREDRLAEQRVAALAAALPPPPTVAQAADSTSPARLELAPAPALPVPASQEKPGRHLVTVGMSAVREPRGDGTAAPPLGPAGGGSPPRDKLQQSRTGSGGTGWLVLAPPPEPIANGAAGRSSGPLAPPAPLAASVWAPVGAPLGSATSLAKTPPSPSTGRVLSPYRPWAASIPSTPDGQMASGIGRIAAAAPDPSPAGARLEVSALLTTPLAGGEPVAMAAATGSSGGLTMRDGLARILEPFSRNLGSSCYAGAGGAGGSTPVAASTRSPGPALRVPLTSSLFLAPPRR